MQLQSNTKIYVAGHRGLVGSAICRELESQGFRRVITAPRSEVDLKDQGAVRHFFQRTEPEVVILAAAKVGGIGANVAKPAEFIYDNLVIATNIIDAAYRCGVKKLLNLGSSCIYPKFAEQPIREEALLSGPLEPTNRPYALAKIAAIELCDSYRKQYGADFISAMPTNLYGPGDNFDLETSHVLPAMIRKFHDGKVAGKPEVLLWGSGTPRREFLYVDDLARACLHLLRHFSGPGFINVGPGTDLSIRELSQRVASVVGFQGTVVWDRDKPDGTPRKLLDVTRLGALGFSPSVSLEEGVARTYRWFLEHQDDVRERFE